MLNSQYSMGNPQPWEPEEFQVGKPMSSETIRIDTEIRLLSDELQQLKSDAFSQPRPADEIGGHRKQQLACVAAIEDDDVGPRSVSAPVGKVSGSERDTLCAGPLPVPWGRIAGPEPEPELAGSARSGSWGLGQESERTSQSSTTRASEGELLPSEARIRSELLANPRYATFVAQLEGESVRFREAVNVEKQKLLDMKRAEQKKRQLWKVELEKIEAELQDKGLLEKRLAQSRAEVERLQCQLQTSEQPQQVDARESGADLEEKLVACQRELDATKAKLKKTESMNNDLRQYNQHQQTTRKVAVLKAAEAAHRIASRSPAPASRTPTAPESLRSASPRVAAPQASLRPDSRSGRSMQDIFGLFITHVQEPLQAVRASCQESLEAASDPFADKCPPGPAPIDAASASDDEYIARLVSIVEVLRCFAKARGLRGTSTGPCVDSVVTKRTPTGPFDAFGPRGDVRPETGSPSFGQVGGSPPVRRVFSGAAGQEPFKTVFSGAASQESFDVQSPPSEVRRSQSSFAPFDRGALGALRSESSRAEDRSESPMRPVRAKTAFGLGLIGGGSAAVAAACAAPTAGAVARVDVLAPSASQGDRRPQGPCAGDGLAATAPEGSQGPRRGNWMSSLLGEHSESVAEWFLSDRDRSPRT